MGEVEVASVGRGSEEGRGSLVKSTSILGTGMGGDRSLWCLRAGGSGALEEVVMGQTMRSMGVGRPQGGPGCTSSRAVQD